MSDTTKGIGEIVRTYYRDIDSNDVDAALAHFAPTSVYRRPGYEPLEGIDAIRAFYGGTRVIADGRHELESVIVGDGAVAVRGAFTGTSHDGAPLATRFSDFWDFDGDRIIERNTYFDAAAV